MKQKDDETYLTTQEVKQEFGWGSSTIYYFRDLGLAKAYKFLGDRHTYWKQAELIAIQQRPPEIKKPGPKESPALLTI